MSTKNKGLLIQFYGLPISITENNIKNFCVNLDPFLFDNKGDLGGLDLDKVLTNPFMYYEFGLLELIGSFKSKYNNADKRKENLEKIKDEFELYRQYFDSEILKSLKNNEIVVATNPIEISILQRLKILYEDKKTYEEFNDKLQNLHKNINKLNIYIQSDRIFNTYDLKNRYRKELISKFTNNIAFIHNQKLSKKSDENIFLLPEYPKTVLIEDNMINYFKKSEEIYLEYAKNNGHAIISPSTNSIDFINKTYECVDNYMKKTNLKLKKRE